MPLLQLPAVPAPHAGLPEYLAQHPDTPVTELFEPYRKYEATLRELFAQEPGHSALADPHVNVLPLFTKDTPKLRVRARDLAAESEEIKAKYIMPLPKENRRPDGALAVVPSLQAFQNNFSVFTESSLADISWDNMVAAGSSVVNCLLPVPDKYNKSRRTLRDFFHSKFSPASDVDLFLYGLTEDQAIEKIKQIEASIRDSILAETTTVRTKNAITICSEHPTRHVQIVLRIYKSVSEILAGFDIDCSGAAYDGKQVYCTPRALQSYMTQINHIDLTRRSPSYENRLSKYSHRNFEVYWSELDRSRIDPTIFERSFSRTVGLARLLVLERLPSQTTRLAYDVTRRSERGRPTINHSMKGLRGNLKDEHEDEVSEWVSQDDVSGYDTFVLPYGQRYHAKRIEKLCYTRDLLLNAEWNQKKSREVYLHRHPAFFGRAEDVMEDCCGSCPKAVTDKEKEVAEEESKIYISGKVSFLTDNPGRQQIGSFSPITNNDWTEMAYVGDTARLCQAIVDGDLKYVEEWLAQEGVDPNRRDHTGRTPLHLATMASTPEIVQRLVDNGARLVARLVDGRTALHIAAQRGDAQMIKILMDKSTENEAEEQEREDQRRKVKLRARNSKTNESEGEETDEEVDDDEESDGELVDDTSDDGALSTTTASFVKVKNKGDEDTQGDAALNENDAEPDYYNVNVTAWDVPCSALHLAVIEGHAEVVKLLCQEYGADILSPVKFTNSYSAQPSHALLSLSLALSQPLEKAKVMTSTLLSLGATSSQADLHGATAFQKYVENCEVDLVTLLIDLDKTGSAVALKHISFPSFHNVSNPLLSAIHSGEIRMVLKLLDSGAAPDIDFDTWLKSAKVSTQINTSLNTFERNTELFKTWTHQPLIKALRSSNPRIALELLKRGADPDTKTREAYNSHSLAWMTRTNVPQNALMIVRDQLSVLRAYDGEKPKEVKPSKLAENSEVYLDTLNKDSWTYLVAVQDVRSKNESFKVQMEAYEKGLERIRTLGGVAEKKAAIADAIKTFEEIQEYILSNTRETHLVRTEELQGTTYPVEEPTKDYEFVPQFVGAMDITEPRRQGLVDLFEAAWKGDLETIKKLTLAAWGDNKEQPPLAVAVQDAQNNTPFSIAFLRGHYGVATAILEIAQAQYAPEDKPNFRYEAKDTGSDSGSDSDSCCNDSDSDDGNELYRTLVDNDQFTIDNIGEISMEVKSKVKPLDLLGHSVPSFRMQDGKAEQYSTDKSTLFETVFRHNDPRGLKFLLDTATHFTRQKLVGDDDASARFFTLSVSEFKGAIAIGRVELLAEVIKRTGAGLPLEEMAKDSGIEIKEKPRYYQGLTVYGKKRNDWAEAGRQTVTRPTGLKDSPLLHAASDGALESVEWFLSDAPLRCYLEFTQSKAAQGDKRLIQLGQAPGGFEGAISRWLRKDDDLALLSAISCRNHKKAIPVIKYLLKVLPESINAKNEAGYTPLMLATLLGHVDTVRLLIENGADQTKRHEPTYANLLHAALFYHPKAEQLKCMLDVFDRDALARMFCQRTSYLVARNGRTPLHDWLKSCQTDMFCHGYRYRTAGYSSLEEMLDVLRLVLEYSGGRELDVVDSAGDTPLHMLARVQPHRDVFRAIFEQLPKERIALLLRRENTVGATPVDVARDEHLSVFVAEPQNRYVHDTLFSPSNWPAKPAEDFVQSVSKTGRALAPVPVQIQTSKSDVLVRTEETLALLNEYLEHMPSKRQLVSLNEANDVARRVGTAYRVTRYPTTVVDTVESKDDSSKGRSKIFPNAFDDCAYDYAWKWDDEPNCARLPGRTTIRDMMLWI